MKKHKCIMSPSTCVCSVTADEPDDQCPVHGLGEYPPRCATCGRFMRIYPRYHWWWKSIKKIFK